MTYFSTVDHEALNRQDFDELDLSDSPDLKRVHEKLEALHASITSQLQVLNLSLHPPPSHRDPVTFHSVASPTSGGAMALQYYRGVTGAVIVERLMGREEVASARHVELRRHPVLEVRISPEHFAVELLLSPEAWWDQRNLAGKLSITRHRSDFYATLRTLGESFRMGFWRGVHLSDMHIHGNLFIHTHVLNEWLSTFEPGKDWFRTGVWYEAETSELTDADIRDIVMRHIKQLYSVYEHIAWSSDNNFQEFYQHPLG